MTADSKELRTAQSLRKLADGVESHSRSGRFGFGGGMVLDAADLRALLSTNEALARENERITTLIRGAITTLDEADKSCLTRHGKSLDKCLKCDAASGDICWPEYRALADLEKAARQALEPSHDQ